MLFHKNKQHYRIVFYILMALVLYATLTPIKDLPELDFPFKEYLDKVVHILMFIVLGILLKLSYPNYNAIILGLLLVSYGIMIEFLQDWLPTGRSFELIDWLADIVGVVLGFKLFKLIKEKYQTI